MHSSKDDQVVVENNIIQKVSVPLEGTRSSARKSERKRGRRERGRREKEGDGGMERVRGEEAWGRRMERE